MPPPVPRLQAVKPAAAPRRRHLPAIHLPAQAAAATCLLVGLAAVAGALWLIYPPAGIMAAGVELAAGSILYTIGRRGH